MAVDQIIVIDDFLHSKDFEVVRSTLTGDSIKWKFSNAVDDGDKESGNFQFTHRLFANHQIQSELFWDIMPPVLYGLGVVSLIDVKVNLQTVSDRRKVKGFHVDIPDTSSHRTAVLCFDTCDGATLFQDNEKEVKSLQNRLVDFPAHMVHTGVSQTNSVTRIVLNVNYYPHDKRVLDKAVEPLSESIMRNAK